MSSQIQFYEKNKIDLSNSNTVLTVTDAVASNTGQSFVDFVRNRKNTSAWLTTGSTDAANTQLDIDMGSSFNIDTIALVLNNFKAFTIQYFNGSIYTDFSTAISETTNAVDNNIYTFDVVSVRLIRIIITGTQVVDADKVLRQLIITELIGQFEGWPIIENPKHSTNKKRTLMLSGKQNIVESVGGFSCDLTIENLKGNADLTILETVWFKGEGVLMLLNGKDETQFSSIRIGYRNEDWYMVRPSNDYVPEWVNGLYVTGMKIKIKLSEVIK